MKRKFGFLAPLRIPSRAETRALKAQVESHVQDVPSPLTPPLSGFIDRRELDHRTEAALKAACAAVVNGEVIPEEPAAVLTIYRPIHQTKSVPAFTRPNENAISRPQTAAPVDDVKAAPPPVPALTHANRGAPIVRESHYASRPPGGIPRHNTATSVATQVPRQSDSFSQPVSAVSQKSLTNWPTTVYKPRNAVVEESDGSYATPRTASTDRYADNVSTGFTSTAITPSQPPQRVSGQLLATHTTQQKASSRASSEPYAENTSRQPSAWPERRSSKQNPPVKQDPPSRPESRSRFRDWAFRPSSRGAMRPNTAVEPPNVLRRAVSSERLPSRSGVPASAGGYGHGGFTLHERLSQLNLARSASRGSTRASARPSVEGTHFDYERSQTEVNLNRALPPLPGLDTWNKNNGGAATIQSEPTPTTTTTTIPAMHVVSLMKATGLRSASIDSHLLNKEIGIVPLRHESKEITISTGNTGRRISHGHSKSSSTADSCFSPATTTSHRTRSRAASGSIVSALTEDNNKENRVRSPVSSHQARISDAPTQSSTLSRHSLSLAHANASSITADVPNFSRKISIDSHGGIRSAEVTALPPMPVPVVRKRGGLKKVLSSLTLVGGAKRKDSAVGGNWMERFERDGVRTGVMLSRGGGAAAPIVRY